MAAQLARGAELADAGDPLDPDSLAAIELPEPRRDGDALIAHALVIDRYGNASLNVGHDDLRDTGLTLGARVEVESGGRLRAATYASTFADVAPGELLVYQDAYRTLALAVNRGDAATELGLAADAELRLRPAR